MPRAESPKLEARKIVKKTLQAERKEIKANGQKGQHERARHRLINAGQ